MKKLFLMLTLFLFFAGVKGMGNQNIQQMANINPAININIQTLFTTQTIKMLWAETIAKQLIENEIVNQNNPLVQNFLNAINLAKQNIASPPVLTPQEYKKTLWFAFALMNQGKALTAEQNILIQSVKQQLEQNQTILNAIEYMNTISANENVQNTMQAFINDLPTLINQNEND